MLYIYPPLRFLIIHVNTYCWLITGILCKDELTEGLLRALNIFRGNIQRSSGVEPPSLTYFQRGIGAQFDESRAQPLSAAKKALKMRRGSVEPNQILIESVLTCVWHVFFGILKPSKKLFPISEKEENKLSVLILGIQGLSLIHI